MEVFLIANPCFHLPSQHLPRLRASKSQRKLGFEKIKSPPFNVRQLLASHSAHELIQGSGKSLIQETDLFTPVSVFDRMETFFLRSTCPTPRNILSQKCYTDPFCLSMINGAPFPPPHPSLVTSLAALKGSHENYCSLHPDLLRLSSLALFPFINVKQGVHLPA